MAGVEPTRTEAAKAVLKRNSRSFHFASRFLGNRHGERAARLYALCRAIDDLADEAPDAVLADARLASLLQAIAADDHTDAIASAALALRAETGLPVDALEVLIYGVRSDLQPVAIPDEARLVDYAYSVAGTVGLMMCSVLDVDDPRAAPFAVDLGIAMQLTNIARDVGADALFIPETPLVVGAAAEGWEPTLADWIDQSVAPAIAHNPDLATAYFLRGWGAYLREHDMAAAVADVQKAAELAPDEELFTKSVEFLTE
jgi:phytoene synthase